MIGEVVSGRYRIVSRIGSGGAGDVYLAEDTELPRQIALKFISTLWEEDRLLRERFLRETEALSALDHPHICTIYEAGETESGQLYIAMAYYEGDNLRTRLAHGALPPTEAVSCAIAIADGMDKAHRKGFLHRDLKPGNIVITEDGVVKILDFGLVKNADRTQLTETGVTMGTLAYTSPEQIRGEDLDGRSDIFSLGVMLYQMLTGVCPFAAPGAAATLALVLNEDPDPLTETHPHLPHRLSRLIERCMSKKSRGRPSSMAGIREELVEVLAELSPSGAARVRAEHVQYEEEHPSTPWYGGMRARVVATAIAVVALVAAWLLASDPTPYDPGLAVIPIQARDDSRETEQLARGLTADLTAQVTRVAGLRERRWVLPLSLANGAKAEVAANRFGVRDLITGGVRVEGNDIVIDLEQRDALNLQIQNQASWTLSPDTRASPDLVPWLVSALRFELSEDELQTVRAPDPASLEVWRHYIRGLGLVPTDADSAQTLLRAAVHADSSFTPARVAYAAAMLESYESGGDDAWVERIEAELSAVSGDERVRAEAYRVRAELESERGNAKRAAQLHRAAVLHGPANPDFRRSLWYEWFLQGANETAEAICIEGVQLHPGYFGSYEDLAYLYLMTDRYTEAATELETVIQIAPGHDPSYNALGAVYYSLDRWEDAIEMFEHSYDLKRENHAAISNLGTLYYMEGRFEEAASMFELAAAYFDSSHTVLGNLAAALRWIPERKSEYSRALSRATYLAELKLAEDPEDAELLSFLAGYYVSVDSVRALRVARHAANLAPDDPEVIYRVAVVHEEAGDRTQALAYLGSAIQLGYTMREVESEPLLEDLRQDSRYAYLVP